MFEKIKKWHNQGLWTEKMVLDAVEKGILSEAEANEILNKANEI